jgi:hypothetical protein
MHLARRGPDLRWRGIDRRARACATRVTWLDSYAAARAESDERDDVDAHLDLGIIP